MHNIKKCKCNRKYYIDIHKQIKCCQGDCNKTSNFTGTSKTRRWWHVSIYIYVSDFLLLFIYDKNRHFFRICNKFYYFKIFWHTFGSFSTKWWMFAFFAASMISCMLIWRLLSPYAIFSAMLMSNKIGSWDTNPNWERNQDTSKDVKGSPSSSWKEK